MVGQHSVPPTRGQPQLFSTRRTATTTCTAQLQTNIRSPAPLPPPPPPSPPLLTPQRTSKPMHMQATQFTRPHIVYKGQQRAAYPAPTPTLSRPSGSVVLATMTAALPPVLTPMAPFVRHLLQHVWDVVMRDVASKGARGVGVALLHTAAACADEGWLGGEAAVVGAVARPTIPSQLSVKVVLQSARAPCASTPAHQACSLRSGGEPGRGTLPSAPPPQSAPAAQPAPPDPPPITAHPRTVRICFQRRKPCTSGCSSSAALSRRRRT